MKWLNRLSCLLFDHQLYVERVFSKWSRKVSCRICDQSWAMNDDARAFLKWDAFWEQHYKDEGVTPR